jgi:hypothetical protein
MDLLNQLPCFGDGFYGVRIYYFIRRTNKVVLHKFKVFFHQRTIALDFRDFFQFGIGGVTNNRGVNSRSINEVVVMAVGSQTVAWRME